MTVAPVGVIIWQPCSSSVSVEMHVPVTRLFNPLMGTLNRRARTVTQQYGTLAVNGWTVPNVAVSGIPDFILCDVAL